MVTPANAQQALTITPVYGTSTATIVAGPRSVALIDAQLSAADVTALTAQLRSVGKPLTAIYITHAHPDHVLGLDGILAAYPDAKLLATPKTSAAVTAAYAGWRERFAARLAPNTPSATLRFDPVTTGFEVDGVRLDVLDNLHGDDANSTAIWIPSQKVLIGGDILFNQVHVWTANQRTPADRLAWLATLDTLAKLGATTVVSGHARPGLPLDTAAIPFTRDYVKTFDEAASQAANAQALVAAMKAKYPNADQEFFLTTGANAVMAGR